MANYIQNQERRTRVSALHRLLKGMTMTPRSRLADCVRRLTILGFLGLIGAVIVPAQNQAVQSAHPACRIEVTNYKGWHAQQLSNRWLQLIVVPQNGGRLMQVVFGGHSFLFVNPKYVGQYFPPDPIRWFNYGGDKLWPLPEG